MLALRANISYDSGHWLRLALAPADCCQTSKNISWKLTLAPHWEKTDTKKKSEKHIKWHNFNVRVSFFSGTFFRASTCFSAIKTFSNATVSITTFLFSMPNFSFHARMYSHWSSPIKTAPLLVSGELHNGLTRSNWIWKFNKGLIVFDVLSFWKWKQKLNSAGIFS